MTSGPIAPFNIQLLRPFIAAARDALGKTPPGELTAGIARRISNWILKPGEAIIRRWIWLIAARMVSSGAPLGPSPQRRAPKQMPATPSRPRKPAAPRPAPPRFRLTEPMPRPAAQPRAAKPFRAGPRATPDPARIERALTRRIEALEAALADPDAEARRLLSLAARGTRLTLDTARIPGAASKLLMAPLKADLVRLNEDARRAGPPPAPRAHYPPADTS